MSLLVRWIATSLAILAVSYLMDSVYVRSTLDAFIAGAVLSLINAIVKPILVLLTLPVTILTLGLFYFVVSAFCLWLTSQFLAGFAVRGVFTTILASLLISFISTITTSVLTRATEKPRQSRR